VARRKVQRKVKVKEKKSPVGVETKRREVEDNDMTRREVPSTKSQSKRKKIIGGNLPALFLVEFIAHAFRELLEFTLGFGVVGVDHQVLEVP
jgi:hypothetical protein